MKYPIIYSHIQTYGKWEYFPLPEKSGYSHNEIEPDKDGKIEVRINSIYDKYGHTNKNYAVGISIHQKVGNDVSPYKLTVTNLNKGTYPSLKPDVIGVISYYNDESFYKLAQIDNSNDPDAYYFVTASECGHTLQSLKTSNYREPLDEYDVPSEVTFISFKNYLMDVQLSTNTTSTNETLNGLKVSYYIIQNAFDQLYFKELVEKRRHKFEEDELNDISYRVHYNRYQGIFTWDKYDAGDDYEFYLIRQKNVGRTLASNDCYLMAAYQHYAKEGSLPTGFELIQTATSALPTIKYSVDDTLAYYAAVTARINPPLPVRMQYRLLSIPVYEPIVPEDFWVELDPYDPYRLSLALHKTDAFYKFNNSNNNTDMVFRVQEGMYLDDGTVIDIYFYDTVKKIERDDDGNYINYDYTYTMKNGQMDYLLKHTDFTAKTVYIVIKNHNNTAFSSDIMMWNEKDIKKLVEDYPFTINQFMSTKTYLFSFTTYLDEVVDIVVNNELSSNTHTITLYETTNGTEKLIETSRNSSFRHHFKEDDGGEFRLEVVSDMEPYKSVRKIVQLEKSQGEFDDLLPNIPKTMSLLVSRPFYFKYVLNDYKYDELGIVTLYLTFDIIGLYKGFYGKVVVAEDNETALFEVRPKSEADNEFLVEPHPDGEHYHIHFIVNKKPEGDKPCILLLTVDLEEGFSFFTPKQFVVSLSEKEERVDIGGIPQDEERSFTYYVPSDTAKIVTFSYYVGEYSAHIFLSPGETVCTFYNGTYISDDGKEINKDVNDNLLFALPTSPSGTGAYIQRISVKFFGVEASYTLKVVKVKGKVVFREGVRQESTIPFSIKDCSEPAYYIESYDDTITSWTYIELNYGQADFYFRGDYSLHTRTDILPKEADKIGSGFRSLGDLYSVLKIKCTYPVRGSLHVFDNIYEDPLMSNSRYRFFVGDLFYSYTLPSSRPLYLSFDTPFTIDLFIYVDGSKVYQIEKGSPLNLFVEDYQGENRLEFFSMTPTYFEVSIVDDPYQYYEVGEGNHTGISNKNLVSFLPVNYMKEKFTSFQFKMTNIYQDFIYGFMRSTENDRYFLPLPSKSGYSNQVIHADRLRNHQFSAFIGGLFDKVNVDNVSYAFVIEFVDNSTNTTNLTQNIPSNVYPYNVEVTFNKRKENPILEKEQIGYLSTVKSELEYTSLELMDTSDYNEEYIFFSFAFSGNKLDHIYFMNFEDTMIDINPMLTYSTYKIKNPKHYIQMEIGFLDKPSKIVPHSGMSFSYCFTNEISDRYIAFVDSLNSQKYSLKVKKSKVSWEKLTNQYEVNYEVFLFDVGTLSDAELRNEMHVTYSKTGVDTKLKASYSIGDKDSYDVKEKGKYNVVVVAEVKGPAPVRFIYEYNTVTGSGTTSSTWWIILIIVLAVAAIAAGVIFFVLNKRKRDVVLPQNYDPLMGSINQ
ncbi:MAG: hypothetical protein MJ252_05470, partial [archaeon]|nr:hypothetical protein [archaeon]